MSDERCILCGRDPAEGFANIDNGAGFRRRLCHGASQRISCYVRWTVYDERPAGSPTAPKGPQ